MRVLLTAPRPVFSLLNQRAPTNALYVLAGLARAGGHDVEVLDHASLELSLEGTDIPKGLPAFAPYFLDSADTRLLDDIVQQRLTYPNLLTAAARVHCVGVSTNTLNWLYARKMIQDIRRVAPHVTIVVGGPHPTFCPEEVLRRSAADVAVRGEGEVTFTELLAALQRGTPLRHVAGISFKQNDVVVHNAERPVLSSTELGRAPLPAYDLLADEQFDVIGVEGSRGCPFRCKFCSIPHKGAWRGLSADEVLRRVQHARRYLDRLRPNALGKREILFVDDNFSTDVRRCWEILDGLHEGASGNCEFSFEGRATDVARNPDIATRLAHVPVHRWLCGIESGSDRGLRNLRKGLTVANVERCSELLAEAGLGSRTRYSFILGLPWENRRDCCETVEFMLRTATRFGIACQSSWYGVFPGSVIWDNREEYGFDADATLFETHYLRSREVFLRVSNGLSADDVRAVLARHRTNILLASLVAGAGSISDLLDLEPNVGGALG
jgi:anaerobic magnesium-protoporphyrin IX monomethyl ester cyclase